MWFIKINCSFMKFSATRQYLNVVWNLWEFIYFLMFIKRFFLTFPLNYYLTDVSEHQNKVSHHIRSHKNTSVNEVSSIILEVCICSFSYLTEWTNTYHLIHWIISKLVTIKSNYIAWPILIYYRFTVIKFYSKYSFFSKNNSLQK